jgi:hypothetical protein
MRTNEFSLAKAPQDTPGWMPTVQNKRTLLEDYRAALGSQAFVNRSQEAVEECLNFVHLPNGSIEHSGTQDRDDPTGARVNHGDRVVADALAWKMAKDVPNASPSPREQEPLVLSLGWRRQLHEQAQRREEAWG